MARTNNNFRYLVISCNIADKVCADVIGEVERFFHELYTTRPVLPIYFLDSFENELFFRDEKIPLNPNYSRRLSIYYKTW